MRIGAWTTVKAAPTEQNEAGADRDVLGGHAGPPLRQNVDAGSKARRVVAPYNRAFSRRGDPCGRPGDELHIGARATVKVAPTEQNEAGADRGFGLIRR